MWPPPKISLGTSLANDESRDFALQYPETTFTLINFHCRAEDRNGSTYNISGAGLYGTTLDGETLARPYPDTHPRCHIVEHGSNAPHHRTDSDFASQIFTSSARLEHTETMGFVQTKPLYQG